MDNFLKLKFPWKTTLFWALLLFLATPCHAYDVTLAWDANLEPDIAGYLIYYKFGSSGPPYNGTDAAEGTSPITVGTGNPNDPKNPVLILSDPNNPQFTLTGLNDNEIYYFVVTAYDIDNLESGYSNVVDNDEDNDGMADNWENAYFGGLNNDGTADGDNDGLSDLGEFQNKTDPTNWDSDSDQMPDGWEVNYGLNPLDEADGGDYDSDWDGFSNVYEYNAGRHPTNCEPYAPLLLSPLNNQPDLPLAPALETYPFEDFQGCRYPDNAHGETEWQISTSGDFSAAGLIFLARSNVALTSLTLPDLILSPNRIYYWRARFNDDGGATSDWSDPFSFTTVPSDDLDQNGDGIPDDQEIFDPTLDLDGDGTFDIDQMKNDPKFKCLNATTGGGQIGVKGGMNVFSIDAIKSIDPSTIPPTPSKPDEFILGLISLKVKTVNAGDFAEVTLYFSESIPTGAKFFKYDSIKGLREYSFVTFGTTAGGNSYVTLELRDGDPNLGDIDGLENTYIIDPGGVGVASTPSQSADSGGGGGGGGCFIATAVF